MLRPAALLAAAAIHTKAVPQNHAPSKVYEPTSAQPCPSDPHPIPHPTLLRPSVYVDGLSRCCRWESLDSRPTPTWWTEQKFSLFMHWGLYAVPSYCPVTPSQKTCCARTHPHPQPRPPAVRLLMCPRPALLLLLPLPLACLRCLLCCATPPLTADRPAADAEHFWDTSTDNSTGQHAYMKRVYGKDFEYQDFAPLFTCADFDPAEWAALFKASGARGLTMTSKHHEGWTLWPNSRHANWNAMDTGPHRDLLQEVGDAVRAEGLKFGFCALLMDVPTRLNSSELGRCCRQITA